MRRGRIISGLTLLIAAATLSVAPAALAASPQDICNDLKDGVVNGTYTSAEWTAYFSDPVVQGYGCGTIVPPPVTTTVTTTTQTPPATTTTVTPSAVTPSAVPLTPVVAGVQVTRTSNKPAPAVKGVQHTVKAPTTQAAAAPIATTRTTGTLPFTGAQLALFTIVGLALIASGLLLRSTSRQSQR